MVLISFGELLASEAQEESAPRRPRRRLWSQRDGVAVMATLVKCLGPQRDAECFFATVL